MSDLFDGEYIQDTAAAEDIRRLQEQHLTAIEHGIHPLTRRTDIHGRADLDASPLDPPDLPLRCGTCRHRETSRWPKCRMQRHNTKRETDVEPWWPACILYEPAA